jgi:hypothetical protein
MGIVTRTSWGHEHMISILIFGVILILLYLSPIAGERNLLLVAAMVVAWLAFVWDTLRLRRTSAPAREPHDPPFLG